MAKHTIALLILLFAVSIIYSQEKECKDYKTGKFLLESEKYGTKYTIERSDSIQFETDLTTGESTTLSVTWINECTYELRLAKKRRFFKRFFKEDILTIEILEVFDNGYRYSAKMNNSHYIQYDRVSIME